MKSHVDAKHVTPPIDGGKTAAEGRSGLIDELAARRPSSIIEAKIRSEIRRDLEMMVEYAAKLGFRSASK